MMHKCRLYQECEAHVWTPYVDYCWVHWRRIGMSSLSGLSRYEEVKWMITKDGI